MSALAGSSRPCWGQSYIQSAHFRHASGSNADLWWQSNQNCWIKKTGWDMTHAIFHETECTIAKSHKRMCFTAIIAIQKEQCASEYHRKQWVPAIMAKNALDSNCVFYSVVSENLKAVFKEVCTPKKADTRQETCTVTTCNRKPSEKAGANQIGNANSWSNFPNYQWKKMKMKKHVHLCMRGLMDAHT